MDVAAEAGWLGAGPAGPLQAGLGLLAATCLLGAGPALFANIDVRQLRAWERAVLALGLALACGLAWFLVASRPGSLALGDPLAWPGVLRPVASLVALVLMLPALASFWTTGLAPAWALLALALAGLTLAALPGLDRLVPVQIAYLLLAAAGLAFRRLSGLRGGAASQAQPAATPGLLDAGRLDRAFAWTVAGLWRDWRGIGGDRQVKALLGQFNNFALAAGWRLQVVGGEVEQSLSPGLSLAGRGDAYAASLTLMLDLMARHVGEKLAVRALQRAYDGLLWDQREVAAQYIFPHVRRAEALSRRFHDTRQNYRALLRRTPLFATMNDDELDLICTLLQAERFAPGRLIIRQGERGDRFYVIEQGHVEVTHRDERGVTEIVDHLDRGDYFGELALLHDAPRNATCRATVPTGLVSLSRDDFDRLVKQRFELRDKLDRTLAPAELLRRVPLFADLDSCQLQLIAARMRRETYAPGDEIIRQGAIGDTFYVIESGCAQTVVTYQGGERLMAQRGPGEYVGEIALLLQVPRTATVRALTPM
ncbi:MAG: cyclic nucleotide-binding domain-containing protein, partial [Chloroflexi bacterium]